MREIDNYLIHYGVKGMKWGVRKFENEDGSLTRTGRVHKRRVVNYHKGESKKFEKLYHKIQNKSSKIMKNMFNGKGDINAQFQQLIKLGKGAVTAKSMAKVNRVLSDEYNKETLKPGSDYTAYKRNKVELTETGKAKTHEIIKQLDVEFNKKRIE